MPLTKGRQKEREPGAISGSASTTESKRLLRGSTPGRLITKREKTDGKSERKKNATRGGSGK